MASEPRLYRWDLAPLQLLNVGRQLLVQLAELGYQSTTTPDGDAGQGQDETQVDPGR